MIKTVALFKIVFLLFLIASIIQAFSIKCYAVEPEEFLQNKKQELRARIISKNVRCVVCQNQSIDDSAAPLAKDLRIIIRNKIKEGYTDKEIYKFLTDRYGDFVLLDPPFKINTFLLWVLPFVFSIIAIYILFRYNKNSRKI